jgi:hypothetical protein
VGSRLCAGRRGQTHTTTRVCALPLRGCAAGGSRIACIVCATGASGASAARTTVQPDDVDVALALCNALQRPETTHARPVGRTRALLVANTRAKASTAARDTTSGVRAAARTE